MMGLFGIFYGMIVLKVTGLGYFRANQRTMRQKALLYATVVLGTTGSSIVLFEKSKN